MANRFLTWAQARMPSRESLMRNRWIAPLAKRPELWVFSRRTVPRAVAIGLFIGIFLMIPGLQVIGAVLLCVPFRANIPVAAAATFVSLPPTVIFVFLPAGAAIGNLFGYHADVHAMTVLFQHGAPWSEWLAWIKSDAAPALGLGLTILGLSAALLGYVITAGIWRWRVLARRRSQLRARRDRA
ncbi:DUF2062 domain-containing protein [Novosphingobium sp.]|uniref:DUF2062 domain-containing protein n=1 Tax=Novosphingobium sp. TaxID=1874826 RepID=UPI003B52CDE9